MALSAMEENIRELGGRDGAYPYYQAANVKKLATKRFKRAEERYDRKEAESKRQWQSEFDRRQELDIINEELDRARLALSQATSGRADTSAEMNRIGDFYPSATTEARSGTREDLIRRGLIPESLQNEAMFDPNRNPSYDAYPRAQAGMYANTRSPLLNYGKPTSRIVNAPAGTPINPGMQGYQALANLKALMSMGKSTTTRSPNPLLPYGMGSQINIQRQTGQTNRGRTGPNAFKTQV